MRRQDCQSVSDTPVTIESSATLSPCGLYRYTLERTWDPERATVVFCMLNPSTADASVNDPTIMRCLDFARSLEAGRLVVVNLFALRSTDPEGLRAASDPVGPDNDRHLLEQTAGRLVVCGWGSTIAQMKSLRLMDRPAVVKKLLTAKGDRLWCLGRTKDGHPRHPLYLKKSAVLEAY